MVEVMYVKKSGGARPRRARAVQACDGSVVSRAKACGVVPSVPWQ